MSLCLFSLSNHCRELETKGFRKSIADIDSWLTLSALNHSYILPRQASRVS